MRIRIRHFLAGFLVAVMAFANAIGLAAETMDHPNADLAHLAMSSADHHHSHSHDDATAHSNIELAASAVCDGAECSTDNQPGERSCHTHGHCCTTGSFIPPNVGGMPDLMIVRTNFAIAAASIPLGALSYPLLRPPRAVV